MTKNKFYGFVKNSKKKVLALVVTMMLFSGGCVLLDKVDEGAKFENSVSEQVSSVNKTSKVEVGEVEKEVSTSTKKESSRNEEKVETKEVVNKKEEQEVKQVVENSNTVEQKVDTTVVEQNKPVENKVVESKPADNKVNESNDGSTAKVEGSKPADKPVEKPKHVHDWVEQYKTVKHDAEYDEVYVVDKEAWVEKVPVTEMVERMYCNGCGEDVTGKFLEDEEWWNDHTYNHALKGEKSGFHTDWLEDVVGYDKVKHKEEGHYEKVKVKDAWSEKVSVGFKCSECGATK